MSFFNTCKALNIDVVAGCDFNEHMRVNFLKQCPGAFATASEEEFLKQDFDAVLLATFCPAHGPHTIKCLQAGKHVLAEVTSFFTMAEASNSSRKSRNAGWSTIWRRITRSRRRTCGWPTGGRKGCLAT